ncbi:MAG TPA: hypothetical protein H9956_02410 [Candidatus Eisenbergiella pullicola]|nr:hypothetical protein [Candidatus Eisenbergiella pullicola]
MAIMVRDIDMKKRWRKIAAALGAVIFCLAAGILLWGRDDDEAKAAAVLQEEVPSTKQAVLDLERGNDAMVPVGNREKMTRLTILRDGEAVFEIEKRPSENQEDFMEWYVTEPYKSPQLVNVSDLYEFLDHYASWDCIGSGNEEGFQESGTIVEEEFSDTGTVRIHLGKKEENTAQTILIEAGDSRKVYEVEEKTLQAMTGLNPEDFMMGIANLVYLTTVESLQIETRKVSAFIEVETDENNGQVYRAAGNELDGDQQYPDERPIVFQSNSAQVKLVISGNIMLFYVDDVALTSRCYEIGRGEIGMFAEYGTAVCTNSKLLMQEIAEE